MIYILTHFNGQQSTELQRGFVMAWLVLGQVYGWLLYSLLGSNGMLIERVRLFVTLIVGAGAVGGFVVVGQMMMADEVCTVI